MATANSLPAERTSFIGREREIGHIRRLLAATQVLTLTGPGGIGKTRLAIRVAADVQEAFPNGVCFVALAPIRDPAMLVPTIAQALGVRETDGQPLLERLHDAVSVSDDDETTRLVGRRIEDLEAAITAWTKLPAELAEARLFPLAQFIGDVYAGALLTEQAAWEQATGRTDRKALVARLHARRYLADRGPLRGIDEECDEGLERFDELVNGTLTEG